MKQGDNQDAPDAPMRRFEALAKRLFSIAKDNPKKIKDVPEEAVEKATPPKPADEHA